MLKSQVGPCCFWISSYRWSNFLLIIFNHAQSICCVVEITHTSWLFLPLTVHHVTAYQRKVCGHQREPISQIYTQTCSLTDPCYPRYSKERRCSGGVWSSGQTEAGVRDSCYNETTLFCWHEELWIWTKRCWILLRSCYSNTFWVCCPLLLDLFLAHAEYVSNNEGVQLMRFDPSLFDNLLDGILPEMSPKV